jgi:hypothetical protein
MKGDIMNLLSEAAKREVAEGRALLLADALNRIVDEVEEVVSYTLVEPPDDPPGEDLSRREVHFQCRVHQPFVMPLTMLSTIPGIVSIETLNNIILVLKGYTDQTVTFKNDLANGS